jgi:hypothetical protein
MGREWKTLLRHSPCNMHTEAETLRNVSCGALSRDCSPSEETVSSPLPGVIALTG